MSEKKPLEGIEPLERNRCEHWWYPPELGDEEMKCEKDGCGVSIPLKELREPRAWLEHPVLRQTDPHCDRRELEQIIVLAIQYLDEKAG